MNDDLHHLNDGSVVTGERAALLLDDERQSHKRTSGELVDTAKAMIALADEWERKSDAYRAEHRNADANLADQFVSSLRETLKRVTRLVSP